jgi:Fe-Mn family superoxide dismutase
MSIALPPLPYAYDALAPYINETTLRVHHDKHHAKYVNVTNTLIAGTEMEKEDVVTILRKAYGTNQGLFNNAAQSYNHAFYWDCMKPNGGGKPTWTLEVLINNSFGSFDQFREEFVDAGVSVFGSGWAWLVWTPSGLKVTKTIGADCPLTEKDAVPLLTMDVWEHAYYLDYQNVRTTYIDAFLDHLVNWDFVAAQVPANA